jgi:hypothetical protein
MKKMKLPNLPKRTAGARSETPKPDGAKRAAKTQIRAPQAVEDLYRDMRDRRLLLPALALILAIIAVPFLLSASKDPAPAATVLQPPEGAEAVAPAVVTEQPVGVRDYRKRLDELKSKDPFAGSFSSADDAAAAADDGELVDPPSSTTPSSTVAPSSTSPTSSTTTSPAPTDTSSSSSGSTDDGGGSDGGQTMIVLAPRIDVRGGLVHKRKRLEDVEIGDLVPDQRKAPIAMFLGVSDDLESAQFVVSDEVSDTDGDGKCRPSGSHCEFLSLREDEKRYFTFGPDDERFSLKVTDIREEIVDRRKVPGD